MRSFFVPCLTGRVAIEPVRAPVPATLVLLWLPLVAVAERPAAELTVFGGYRAGGGFDVRDTADRLELDGAAEAGLALNFAHSANTQWELIYVAQDTRAEAAGTELGPVDIDSRLLQIGGTYLFREEHVQPYVAATIGMTRLRTTFETSADDTFLSGSFGLGLRVLPSARVGLRLELRLHATLTDRDTELFCRSGPEVGACDVRVEGSLLGQVSAFTGVSFRF